MRIGQDVSLKECYESGYLVMEYKKRKLFPKGKFDHFAYVRFIRHLPIHCREFNIGNKLDLDVDFCAVDLYTYYEFKQKEIDSSVGRTEKLEMPTNEYELLNLAVDVDSYIGLANL